MFKMYNLWPKDFFWVSCPVLFIFLSNFLSFCCSGREKKVCGWEALKKTESGKKWAVWTQSVYFGVVCTRAQAIGGSETQGRVAWTILPCPVKVKWGERESDGSSGWGGTRLCAAGRTWAKRSKRKRWGHAVISGCSLTAEKCMVQAQRERVVSLVSPSLWLRVSLYWTGALYCISFSLMILKQHFVAFPSI